MSSLFLRLFFFLLIWIPLSWADDSSVIPSPPEVGAKAYVLIDFDSGRVLAESNPDARLEPASLTKIMTAYVVFRELAAGKLHLDDMVTVSEKAWRTEGSRMFAQVGAKIAVENLLKGMIVQSGNDASVALAEHIAGDETVFAQMMNQNAVRLGMKNTHFKNSMGLPDPEHYASARDLSVLTRAMISEFPEYYKWHAIKEFIFNNIKQVNRNRLLWRDTTVDGVKTGHTEGAGYCLVASALRGGMRLISVVMGTKSDNDRANANQALLNYGFHFFETRLLYKANESLTEAKVWMGREPKVAAGLKHNLSVTFPRGQYAKLNAATELTPHITAPLKQGDTLGKAKVTYNQQTVVEQDIVALQDVQEAGFFGRLMDRVIMVFKK